MSQLALTYNFNPLNDFDTVRGIANLCYLASEKLDKSQIIHELFRHTSIALNGFFFARECIQGVKILAGRLHPYLTNPRARQAGNPEELVEIIMSLAGVVLNLAFAGCSLACYWGVGGLLVQRIGSCSILVPYMTNFFRQFDAGYSLNLLGHDCNPTFKDLDFWANAGSLVSGGLYTVKMLGEGTVANEGVYYFCFGLSTAYEIVKNGYYQWTLSNSMVR